MLFESSDAWVEESAKLVRACPKTIVTSKYAFTKLRNSQIRKHKKWVERSTAAGRSGLPGLDDDPAKKKSASFVLKAFDPNSGACLKYSTDKAAEVGRLMSALERLSRTMAGLPDQPQPPAGLLDTQQVIATDSLPTTVGQALPPAAQTPTPASTKTQQGAAQGKKKKKGKR